MEQGSERSDDRSNEQNVERGGEQTRRDRLARAFWVFFPAVVAAGLIAHSLDGSCDAHVEVKLDRGPRVSVEGVEVDLERHLEREGLDVTSVSCPDDLGEEEGATYLCVARIGQREAKLHVVLVLEEMSYDLGTNDIATVRPAMWTKLASDAAAHWTPRPRPMVDCKDLPGMVLMGERVRCDAVTGGGERFSVFLIPSVETLDSRVEFDLAGPLAASMVRLVKADNLTERGASLLQQGRRWREAQEAYTGALAIYREELGDDHPRTAWAHHALAEAYGEDAAYERAAEHYAHALAGLKEAGEPATDLASVTFDLARVTWERGRRDAALELAERARAGYAGAGETERARQVVEWIAERAPSAKR